MIGLICRICKKTATHYYFVERPDQSWLCVPYCETHVPDGGGPLTDLD